MMEECAEQIKGEDFLHDFEKNSGFFADRPLGKMVGRLI